MYIKWPLIWSQAVIDKIWKKHRVIPEEVEEAIFNDRTIAHKGKGNVYCIYGRNQSGRYVFIVVSRKGKGQFKVLTAREMIEKERKYYLKHVV
mgnify:CR=1 FL=1